MEIQILKIVHRPGAKKPLALHLHADGKDYVVDCKASDIQTWPRFQTMIADQFGLWLNDDFSGRQGRRDWQDEITSAFERGRQ